MLDDRGACRKLLIATAGCQQEEVHVGGIHAGHGQCVAPGLRRHLGHLSVDVAGPDTTAFTDPLVGGVHDLSEIVVGEPALGKMGCPTGDTAVGHGVLRCVQLGPISPGGRVAIGWG